MRYNHLLILAVILGVTGCASQNKITVQEQPPGFLGQIIQNTTARYNAYYNSNKIYEESLLTGAGSYQEDYTEELPVSVQDALATSGSMGGEMDQVIKKTAKAIDKKPYSKWKDDHYLLNGIAHYVKGEYEMALDIFTYVSSEYKNGVEIERVGARQKVKRVDLEKIKKEQAKEKLEEYEQQKEENEKEYEEKVKQRKKEAEEKQKKEERTTLSRDEQFKLKQQAQKEGREVTTEELLEEIREQQKILDEEGKELSEEDVEAISQAPVKTNKNENNPGFLGHPLAAKDAMLWLAKTYITTEKYIAADAVLTAINEDPSFPNRLNREYYLTYADMHIQLQNLPKAAEYIQLAIESSKNREKGRLYYVLGQVYEQNDQPELAREAFASVRNYHPEYNMIYHATMRNLRKDYENGVFAEKDYVSRLEKMTRDAKNEEFFGEVYYYLGNAYAANNNTEKALEAYNRSLEEEQTKPFSHSQVHLSLADYYYKIDDYPLAQQNYEAAAEKLPDESVLKQQTQLKASALQIINDGYENIHLQDSLLTLSDKPQEELLEYLEEKIDRELKEKMRSKLKAANEEFGSGSTTRSANMNNRQNQTDDLSSSSGAFYFYDVQQAVRGYSDFNRVWGNRPNVDGWRRSAYVNQFSRTRSKINLNTDEEAGSPTELLNQYLAEIPSNADEQARAKNTIREEYINIGRIFIKELGEFEKGENVLKELVETRQPTEKQKKKVQDLLLIAYEMKGDDSYKKSLQQTAEGKQAVSEALSNKPEKNSEIEQLYTQTYQVYQNGDYSRAIELVEQSENYVNNIYKDKFAFILATSKGFTEGAATMKTELRTFINQFPDSELKPRAIQMSKNN